MTDGKAIAGFLVTAGAIILALFWFLLQEDKRAEENRQWRKQIHRRIVENCVNRGGIPTYDNWNGDVDNCVGVSK